MGWKIEQDELDRFPQHQNWIQCIELIHYLMTLPKAPNTWEKSYQLAHFCNEVAQLTDIDLMDNKKKLLEALYYMPNALEKEAVQKILVSEGLESFRVKCVLEWVIKQREATHEV